MKKLNKKNVLLACLSLSLVAGTAGAFAINNKTASANENTLKMMSEAFGEGRRIAVCRELTKRNEEVLRFTLGDAMAHFTKTEPKGEFVLVLDGRKENTDAFWLEMSVPEHVLYYVGKMGLDKMSAVKAAAKDRGLPKNAVYKEFLNYENK